MLKRFFDILKNISQRGTVEFTLNGGAKKVFNCSFVDFSTLIKGDSRIAIITNTEAFDYSRISELFRNAQVGDLTFTSFDGISINHRSTMVVSNVSSVSDPLFMFILPIQKDLKDLSGILSSLSQGNFDIRRLFEMFQQGVNNVNERTDDFNSTVKVI